jgi:hypothetical protein
MPYLLVTSSLDVETFYKNNDGYTVALVEAKEEGRIVCLARDGESLTDVYARSAKAIADKAAHMLLVPSGSESDAKEASLGLRSFVNAFDKKGALDVASVVSDEMVF